MPAVCVSSALDGGNIRVVDAASASDIRLEIKPEPYTEKENLRHFQWFHFRVVAPPGTLLVLRILNAGDSSFPEAWPGYQACCSHDYEHWFRVPTEYDEAAGVLTFRHTPDQGRTVSFFSYFAPYPYVRHQMLVAEAASQRPDLVRCEVLGQTLDGRDVDMLVVGHPGAGKRRVWVIARQHPGETMAEWSVEGLVKRLLDRHDALVDACLQSAVFYVVPNANPDGSIRGHLRTNAAGANLNREWKEPRLDYSPEVYHILAKMDEVGCDAFADVHGDEEFPVNFVAGAEGIPDWSDRMQALQATFTSSLMAASPDMQPENKYGVDPPGQADMSIACNAVAERFRCLSITVESPFKDVASHPDRFHGWSPQRSRNFGGAMLQALHGVLQHMVRLEGSGGQAAAGEGGAAARSGGGT